MTGWVQNRVLHGVTKWSPSPPVPAQFIPNQPHWMKKKLFPQSLSTTPCWLMHPPHPHVQSSSPTVISLRVHCAPFSSTVHLFCGGSSLASWSSFSSCSFWTHSVILRSSKGWDTSWLKIRCHNVPCCFSALNREVLRQHMNICHGKVIQQLCHQVWLHLTDDCWISAIGCKMHLQTNLCLYHKKQRRTLSQDSTLITFSNDCMTLTTFVRYSLSMSQSNRSRFLGASFSDAITHKSARTSSRHYCWIPAGDPFHTRGIPVTLNPTPWDSHNVWTQTRGNPVVTARFPSTPSLHRSLVQKPVSCITQYLLGRKFTAPFYNCKHIPTSNFSH